jgi:hypothetical protein
MDGTEFNYSLRVLFYSAEVPSFLLIPFRGL